LAPGVSSPLPQNSSFSPPYSAPRRPSSSSLGLFRSPRPPRPFEPSRFVRRPLLASARRFDRLPSRHPPRLALFAESSRSRARSAAAPRPSPLPVGQPLPKVLPCLFPSFGPDPTSRSGKVTVSASDRQGEPRESPEGSHLLILGSLGSRAPIGRGRQPLRSVPAHH
jgi:hypothetical protein